MAHYRLIAWLNLTLGDFVYDNGVAVMHISLETVFCSLKSTERGKCIFTGWCVNRNHPAISNKSHKPTLTKPCIQTPYSIKIADSVSGRMIFSATLSKNTLIIMRVRLHCLAIVRPDYR